MRPDPFVLDRLTTATGPVLTLALASLRQGFNIAFPLRDKESDGWIGDPAHQAEVSGHNPDDTPGVKAEFSDVDTIPEVRAIDVDADLRNNEASMMDVIALILRTPRDTKRLRYIIHNETVWSKSEGWLPRKYNGVNPHRTHAHFSGDPLYDNDGTPWSVQTMGDGMYTEDQMRAFPWQYDGRGIGENDGVTVKRSTLSYLNEILGAVRRIESKVDALATTPPAPPAAHTHATGPALPVTDATA